MADIQDKQYKATFLPVFLVVDTSWSMGEQQPGGTGRLIDVANQMVPMIVEKCREHPLLDQRLRLSLIRFSSDASVVIPLGEADTFSSHVPTLESEGNTYFDTAFELLYSELNNAVPVLKGGNPDFGVYRPTVFFVTDGDDNGAVAARDRAWATLTDSAFKYRPNFFTFGVAEANAKKLKKYKSGYGLVAIAKDPTKAVEKLTEVLRKLVQSIVSSSTGSDPTGNIVVTADDFDPDDWELLE